MSGARSLVVGVLAGVLVGGLLGGAVARSGWLDRSHPVHGDEAIAAFLQAWADNRNGTFLVEASFVRTADDGELRSTVRVAQRPPARLIVQFDEVDATVDGRPLRCQEDDPAGEVVCGLEGSPGASYDELVDDELEVLLEYLVGDPPLYEVTGDGEGCFDLVLARDLPVAPYGHDARFCFDDETGAMVFARIERDEATDVTDASRVVGTVTDADLQPPTDAS